MLVNNFANIISVLAFDCLFISDLSLEIQLQESECWDHIDPWISNAICRGLLCVQWIERERWFFALMILAIRYKQTIKSQHRFAFTQNDHKLPYYKYEWKHTDLQLKVGSVNLCS
jgi:hypothetical protein